MKKHTSANAKVGKEASSDAAAMHEAAKEPDTPVAVPQASDCDFEDEKLTLAPADQAKVREWAEKGLIVAHRVFPLDREHFDRGQFVNECRDLVDDPSHVWPQCLSGMLEQLAIKPHNHAARRLLGAFPPDIGIARPDSRCKEASSESCPVPTLVPIASVKGHDALDLPYSCQVQGLAAQIERAGLLDPIEIDPDGKLLDGRRRLVACQVLGWELIPAVVRRPDEYASVKLASLAADISNRRGGNSWKRAEKIAEYVHTLITWRYPDACVELHNRYVGYEMGQVADELDLPHSHVRQALKAVAGLCPAAKELVADGDYSFGLPVLAVIAGEQDPEVQTEVIRDLGAEGSTRPTVSSAWRVLNTHRFTVSKAKGQALEPAVSQ